MSHYVHLCIQDEYNLLPLERTPRALKNCHFCAGDKNQRSSICFSKPSALLFDADMAIQTMRPFLALSVIEACIR
jgi:hypothetical protein